MIVPPEKPHPVYALMHDHYPMYKFFRVADSISHERQLLAFRRYCNLMKPKLADSTNQWLIERIYALVRNRVFPCGNESKWSQVEQTERIGMDSRIVIRDGRLEMADGSNLEAYLQQWQKEQNVKDGERVNVLDSGSLQTLNYGLAG